MIMDTVAQKTPNIYQNTVLTLHERARAFMADHNFSYDGDFPETGEGQQEKFDSEEGRKDKRSWLKTSYPTGNSGAPGLSITFGRHDATGRQHKMTSWSDDTKWKGLSEEKRKEIQKQCEENRRKAPETAAKDKKIADELADKGLTRFGAARPTPPKEADTYFSRKGLGAPSDALHLRWECHSDFSKGEPVEKWVALAAVRNGKGDFRAIQELWPDKTDTPHGNKKYVGKISGGFYTHGLIKNGEPILITEGVATAITVFRSTNKTAVAAMDCGNLPKVVEELRMRYPKSTITICADNDHKTEGNPGLTAARAVALKYGCKLAVPEFPEGQEVTPKKTRSPTSTT